MGLPLPTFSSAKMLSLYPGVDTIEAMKIALRVLTALGEHRHPDAADVKALKAYAPLLADAPLDELACDVVQQALKRRAEARGKGSGGG